MLNQMFNSICYKYYEMQSENNNDASRRPIYKNIESVHQWKDILGHA